MDPLTDSERLAARGTARLIVDAVNDSVVSAAHRRVAVAVTQMVGGESEALVLMAREILELQDELALARRRCEFAAHVLTHNDTR